MLKFSIEIVPVMPSKASLVRITLLLSMDTPVEFPKPVMEKRSSLFVSFSKVILPLAIDAPAVVKL